MNIRYLFFTTMAILTLGVQPVFGQVTWNGNGNWATNPANWGGTAPFDGDNVFLSSGNIVLDTDEIANSGDFGVLTTDDVTLTVTGSGAARFTSAQLGTSPAGGTTIINIDSGTLEFTGNVDYNRQDTDLMELNVSGTGSFITSGGFNDSWWGGVVLMSVRGPDAAVTMSGTHFVGTIQTTEAIITHATDHTAINIPGTLDIQGGAALRVSFDGVSPNLGDRWTIYDYANTAGGEFTTIDTSLLSGGVTVSVDYAGTGTINANAVEIVVANTLDVLVDTATGAVVLGNPVGGGLPFDIEGYTISSPSGTLDASGFTGLGEANWSPAIGGQGPNFINETNFVDSTVLSSGDSFSLGNIFAGPAIADANGDRVVNGLDYLVWAENFNDDPADDPPGSPANGDFNNDGKVDGLDYLAWAANFSNEGQDLAFNFLTTSGDIVSGTVSYIDSSAVAVPEPSTLMLAGLAFVGFLTTRRRS